MRISNDFQRYEAARQIYQAAVDAGVIVVCSAGNAGTNGEGSITGAWKYSDKLITVGASSTARVFQIQVSTTDQGGPQELPGNPGSGSPAITTAITSTVGIAPGGTTGTNAGFACNAAPPAPGSDLVLSVSVDRAAAGTVEFQEFARLLGLDAQALTYRVAAAAAGGGGRNIAVRPRSILAAMRFLSKGVAVPAADVAAGQVPVLSGATGEAFDWNRMMGGVIRIGSRDDAPVGAHVRVRAHERWFYIDARDIASKQTFALLETAYALHAGDVPPVTTILTLPIAR